MPLNSGVARGGARGRAPPLRRSEGGRAYARAPPCARPQSAKNSIDQYKTDLPNPDNVQTELSLFKSTKANLKDKCPSELVETVDYFYNHRSIFPNLLRLSQIALTLPVTSCEAERSFSTLRRLMTWLRAGMREERLANLARLHTYRDKTLALPNSRILEIFKNKKPRRLEFPIRGQIIIRYIGFLSKLYLFKGS